jgi:6-phosphofructokinase 1
MHGESLGWEIFGIEDGTQGLIDRPIRARRLTHDDVSVTMLRQGGTILGTTNKGNPFAYPMSDGTTKDISENIIDGFKSLGCTAMIGIGGDGSLAILRRLAQQGNFHLIGIPKTIDNDLGMTETSIGFDTAVSVATEALDRLQPTAASHDRIMILEVMGRDAGHIALSAGISGGADVILIPEIPYSLEKIAAHIKSIRDRGRNFALMVVSEAVRTIGGEASMQSYFGGETRFGGIGHYIGAQISELCQAETRVTMLGHVQRGSQPSAQDRMLGQAFGVHAIELIEQGKYDRMVAWSNRHVIDVPIAEAIAHYQSVDPDGTLVKTARGLGICLGG